jgi:hypothetical protein
MELRNAYADRKAPFRLNELSGTLSGPINRRASFNLNLIREWVDNGNVVNGVILDPQTLVPAAFTATPVAALRRTGFTPRIDNQLSTNHTLSVRYSYNRDIVRDAGTGGLNLVSRGYHNNALSQTVQLTETSVLSTSTIKETRFQYFRPETVSQANTGPLSISPPAAISMGIPCLTPGRELPPIRRSRASSRPGMACSIRIRPRERLCSPATSDADRARSC